MFETLWNEAAPCHQTKCAKAKVDKCFVDGEEAKLFATSASYVNIVLKERMVEGGVKGGINGSVPDRGEVHI